MKSFVVLGGDMRSRYLAQALADAGYTVESCALGTERGCIAPDIADICRECDCAVFPVVPVTEGEYLFAPLCSNKIELDNRIADALTGKKVYSGNANLLKSVSDKYAALDICDYCCCESYQLSNARLTAEAAIMLAKLNTQLGICEAVCLVTGFGRIGRYLSLLLASFGATIIVSEPDEQKLADAMSLGFPYAKPGELEAIAPLCDIFINTCTAPVINAAVISKMKKDAIVVELASAPYGCNFDECGKNGICAIKANGLPGKYSAISAGRIMAETIINIEEG